MSVFPSDSMRKSTKKNDRPPGYALLGLVLFVFVAACGSAPDSSPNLTGAIPLYSYRVVNQFPHDASAFTQGLSFLGEKLVESTGKRGDSRIFIRPLVDATVEQQFDLDGSQFGEGNAVVGDRILLLTWTSQAGYVFDHSLALQSNFTYATQGWGLAFNGMQLIMSDGSSFLRELDAEDLTVVRTIAIRAKGQPVACLNELEFYDGVLLANVWQTDLILGVDTHDGTVLFGIDLTGLLPASQRTGQEDVLNGIAYQPVDNRLLVTGKYWPNVYQIELIETDRRLELPIPQSPQCNGSQESSG